MSSKHRRGGKVRGIPFEVSPAKRLRVNREWGKEGGAMVENGHASNGANGQNGDTHMNGSSSRMGEECASTRRLSIPGLPGASFKESELVRLLEQSLYSLGYDSVAESLERESGVQLQSRAVRDFRAGVLNGDWSLVLDLLDEVGVDDSKNLPSAKFLILEQKYLEALDSGDVVGALFCLREELTQLGIHHARLHELASMVLGRRPDPALALAGSEEAEDDDVPLEQEEVEEITELGAPGGLTTPGQGLQSGPSDSRNVLLVKLQEVIPATVMLPERRLERLIGQAVSHQVSNCMYCNNLDTTISLLRDYECGPEQIPSETVQVLDLHGDEVWHVQFSHAGRHLASASADGCAIIWEKDGPEGSFQVLYQLNGHSKPIGFISWSPDDTMLLTCGNDHVLHLWDVATGNSLRTFHVHEDSVTSCAWFPDSMRFVSGSIDKNIYMWSVDEQDPIKAWKGSRINDLAVSRDGKWMVSTSNEKRFRVYDLVRERELYVPEKESIISLSLSNKNDHLLVNLQNQKIHLWDLGDLTKTGSLPTEPLRRYRGPSEKQGRYVIRSCLGGSNQNFVVSGSEDSQVYIWHQNKGDLLKVLPGHSGTVNAVTWDPRDPFTFASASDDHSIRLWSIKR